MKLNDLFIGKVDAKNEILEDLNEKRDLFMGSFFLPDNIVIEDFYNRRRYFVLGYKGTGKTALLRYIEKNSNGINIFNPCSCSLRQKLVKMRKKIWLI